MSITPTALFQGNERTMQPRLAFADKFLELTVPNANVKHLNSSDVALGEVTVSEPAYTLAATPTTIRNGRPAFTYAAVNGKESFLSPNKTPIPVSVSVASINNTEAGIIVSQPLAVGCGVEIGKDGMVVVGVETKSQFVPGKMKELRLGLMTGPDLKVPQDIVLKELPVMVDKNAVDSYIFLGQKFVEMYFKDGVLAVGADGVWKLHGRVDPALLADIKTRPKGK